MQSSSQLHTTHNARFHEYLDSSPLHISLAALCYFNVTLVVNKLTDSSHFDWSSVVYPYVSEALSRIKEKKMRLTKAKTETKVVGLPESAGYAPAPQMCTG